MTTKRKPNDGVISRKKVRDGIIVAEMVSVDLTKPADEVIEALKQLASFQSPEERISAHLAAAQQVVESGAEGNRLNYAQDAVRHFNSALDYLQKITDLTSRKIANDMVTELIRAFESAWRVDVKEIEPVVVTGARANRQRSRAGIASGAERQAERTPEWNRWQKRATELRLKHPEWYASAIFNSVGEEFGVTREAVAKRVRIAPRKKFGTERQRSKN